MVCKFHADDVYKVKAVFIVVLDRTIHILGNLHSQFYLATKITYLLLEKDSIEMHTVVFQNILKHSFKKRISKNSKNSNIRANHTVQSLALKSHTVV